MKYAVKFSAVDNGTELIVCFTAKQAAHVAFTLACSHGMKVDTFSKNWFLLNRRTNLASWTKHDLTCCVSVIRIR